MSRPLGEPTHVDASGREAEIGRLLRALESSRRLDASPQICFVWGPPGIGKTFVLSAFAREVEARGIDLLSGSANRDSIRPYGLFSEVLPAALEMLSALGATSSKVGDLVRRTMPVAGRSAAPSETTESRTAEDRRLDLFEAVSEVFEGLGRNNPPVVMLDDLDAADGASLDLLRYLLASFTGPASTSIQPASRRGLWVLAFRDQPPLHPTLEEMVGRAPAMTLPLDGLDRSGLRAFLSRPAMVDRILDTTGGVPERIEALLTNGSTADVAELLVSRVESLKPVARRALSILAAVGRPMAFEQVESILSAWTGDRLGGVVDDLVAIRMASLRAGGEGPRLSLAPGADGERLLAGLSIEDVRGLHRTVGEQLAREGGDPLEVARHLREADPGGAGYEWTLRAGEALVSRLAYDEAKETFEQALSLLDDPEDGRAADLYERLHSLHASLSEHPRSLRWLGRLKRAYRGDEDALREVNARIARACLAMGRARLAARICARALGLDEAIPPGGDSVLKAARSLDPGDGVGARLFVDLVEAIWTLGLYDETMVLAEEGLEILTASDHGGGFAAERVALRNTLGKLRLHRAEYEEAQAQFFASAKEAEKFELPKERARAFNNLGVVAHRQGRRRDALEHYRASLSLRQETGERAKEAFAFQNMAALYHETGELGAALDNYHRALAAFTRSRDMAQVSRTATNLANLYLFLGDIERASSLSTHSMKVAEEVGDPYLCGYAAMVEGDITRAMDEGEKARERYHSALEMFSRIESPRYGLETRLSLASLSCEMGDPRTASGLLDEASEIMASRLLVGVAPIYHLVAAEVHLAAEDTTEAERCLSRARDLLLESPDLEGPVRLYHLMAHLCLIRGDESGAEANQARSQRLLDELAARVPRDYREPFLSLPRRKAVLEGVGAREITPARLREALSLGQREKGANRRPVADSGRTVYRGVAGKNEKMRKILSLIDRVASVSQPVLIRGASGTGKELIADAIHHSGPRREHPFVKVNCAAMHEDLLLSELFGHERGAFTGAHQMRRGRFEMADGGTLFLDEIGDISAKVQVALLRVMQEQAFERVGGTKTLRVNVRVVCATNRNLEEMIAEGTFREDLYYRLKGIMLEVPSLQERIEDLPELVEHFLQRFSEEHGELRRAVSPDVMNAFVSYSWPGNIRELEQVLQSVSLFAAGEIIEPFDLEQHPEILSGLTRHVDETSLSAAGLKIAVDRAYETESARGGGQREASGDPLDLFATAKGSGLTLKEIKQEVERRCIRGALEEAAGNISEAARLLGMKRSRLSQIVNSDEDLKRLAGR